MNYQAIYNRLCERGLKRKHKHNAGLERHHIIPRCMGGTDDKSNIAILTGREHFVAHQLLVKIYPRHHKLIYGLNSMMRSSFGQVRNAKHYDWIKRYYSKVHSEKMKGREITWAHKISKSLKGKIVSDETKELQSIAQKKRFKDKPESHGGRGTKRPGVGGRKKGCVPWNKNVPMSEETKRKLSETQKKRLRKC